MDENYRTTRSGPFFAVSRFRLASTLLLILMSVVALTPWSFDARIGNMAVINILLTAIMLVGFAVLVIDLVVTRETDSADDQGPTGRKEGSRG